MELTFYNPNEKKTDGRKKRYQSDDGEADASRKKFKGKEKIAERKLRGTWRDDRDKALLLAYKEHHPHGVSYKKRTEQWNKITAKVNEFENFAETKDEDRENSPMAKKSVTERFQKLLEIYCMYIQKNVLKFIVLF